MNDLRLIPIETPERHTDHEPVVEPDWSLERDGWSKKAIELLVDGDITMEQFFAAHGYVMYASC